MALGLSKYWDSAKWRQHVQASLQPPDPLTGRVEEEVKEYEKTGRGWRLAQVRKREEEAQWKGPRMKTYYEHDIPKTRIKKMVLWSKKLSAVHRCYLGPETLPDCNAASRVSCITSS